MEFDQVKFNILKKLNGRVGWTIIPFTNGKLFAECVIESSIDFEDQDSAEKNMERVRKLFDIPRIKK